MAETTIKAGCAATNVIDAIDGEGEGQGQDQDQAIPEDASNYTCFSANSTVHLVDGLSKRMDTLAVGDKVCNLLIVKIRSGESESGDCLLGTLLPAPVVVDSLD